MAKVVKLFLSFTAHSINNTFVAKQQRYDDTSSITALISAFRAEVAQNSISPEKVGSILQQIADLLATAAPDSDMSEFTVLHQRLMGVSTMFTSLAQGTSDRNHIYLTSNTYNVATGTKHTNTDAIRIQQATTERAGAMRAQQVIDLNALIYTLVFGLCNTLL